MVPCHMTVRTDPRLLEQILRNMLSNATKYTRQGRVLLGCRRRGGQLSIEVWDTGTGIPATELSAIFKEFHQLDNPPGNVRRGLASALRLSSGSRTCSKCLSASARAGPGLGLCRGGAGCAGARVINPQPPSPRTVTTGSLRKRAGHFDRGRRCGSPRDARNAFEQPRLSHVRCQRWRPSSRHCRGARRGPGFDRHGL